MPSTTSGVPHVDAMGAGAGAAVEAEMEATSTLVAVPIGLLLGTGFARGILGAVNTETVRLPLILTTQNYAFAVLVVAVASSLSALFVLRSLSHLNLVGALKAPE